MTQSGIEPATFGLVGAVPEPTAPPLAQIAAYEVSISGGKYTVAKDMTAIYQLQFDSHVTTFNLTSSQLYC